MEWNLASSRWRVLHSVFLIDLSLISFSDVHSCFCRMVDCLLFWARDISRIGRWSSHTVILNSQISSSMNSIALFRRIIVCFFSPYCSREDCSSSLRVLLISQIRISVNSIAFFVGHPTHLENPLISDQNPITLHTYKVRCDRPHCTCSKTTATDHLHPSKFGIDTEPFEPSNHVQIPHIDTTLPSSEDRSNRLLCWCAKGAP